MPRPSLKQQRKEEILHAYETCIALYGVEGATLQKIAETAGIARPLLRHYVGNNDELLNQAVDRFLIRSDAQMNQFIDSNLQQSSELIEILLDYGQAEGQVNDVTIALALMIASQTRPELKLKMNQWFNQVSQGFDIVLTKMYPKAEVTQVKTVSAGILGIYFNVDSLLPLGHFVTYREYSRQAMQQLLLILENT
ncbi:TetR/AcrR family transcriptional regulator [Candidatus Albibeggiatoa sp. nov. NOAA]|uniref:TetR/AcrR family transcriptional regulator n=1 Tax=Candidatus Albibeggiatoa sp. nov. NOAA TaxID=3162724 RepID=UPI0032F9191F|nr:TetR/AcrR family transcriptional regulator [Thiotrichaceae bacterium]